MRKYIKVFWRWFKMVFGKSVFHKSQNKGLFWSKEVIRGYYSDLRHKVTDNSALDSLGVPINTTSEGKTFYFPIAIFQYGLGAYDLFLETGDIQYKNKFMDVVKWSVKNQLESGAWDAFGWCDSKNAFSSMAQAEGASLLCRAFSETKDEKYLEYAKKALDFMLVSVENGGTANYDNDGSLVSLEETSRMKTVMNGMIFSIWGLYDYLLCAPDSNYKEKMLQAVDSLASMLPKFDRGYWSNYDMEGHISSPFYHLLHIEQLYVLADMFENETFKEYGDIFTCYQKSWVKKRAALFVKIVQKLKRIKSDVAIIK